MATKTFEELKQLAIQIRDEKTNKQNTATRIGTQMLEHLDKLEQDYYDKTATDEELKERDEKLTELENKAIFSIYNSGHGDDGFINKSTKINDEGLLETDYYFESTDYIELVGYPNYLLVNILIYTSSQNALAFYDKEKNIIGSPIKGKIDGIFKIEVPETAKYVIISTIQDSNNKKKDWYVIGDASSFNREIIDQNNNTEYVLIIDKEGRVIGFITEKGLLSVGANGCNAQINKELFSLSKEVITYRKKYTDLTSIIDTITELINNENHISIFKIIDKEDKILFSIPLKNAEITKPNNKNKLSFTYMGDSLTESGYYTCMQRYLDRKIFNGIWNVFSVGGEQAWDLASLINEVPIIIANSIILPASKEKVEVQLKGGLDETTTLNILNQSSKSATAIVLNRKVVLERDNSNTHFYLKLNDELGRDL